MAIDLRPEEGYYELKDHIGHDLECVGYAPHGVGEFWNVAVECLECGLVLLDFDFPEERK